jgi:hypothetical protein
VVAHARDREPHDVATAVGAEPAPAVSRVVTAADPAPGVPRAAMTADQIRHLQSAAGNRAVVRMLSRRRGYGRRTLARTAKDVVIDETDEMWSLWTKQFVDTQPQARTKITMPAGAHPAQAITVIKRAIATAEQGGRIIFSVGHGSQGQGGALDGMADLAPGGNARLGGHDHQNVWVDVFYDVNVGGANSVSDQQYDRDNNPNGQRAKNWAQYQDLASAFRAGGIQRVIFLTCKVGNAENFIRKIANDWGTVVVAYRDRMEIEDVSTTPGTKVIRVRMHLQSDQPGRGTNIDASEVQIPLATDSNSYAAGPPLP